VLTENSTVSNEISTDERSSSFARTKSNTRDTDKLGREKHFLPDQGLLEAYKEIAVQHAELRRKNQLLLT
jgi:hypothetical protein